MNAEPYRGEWVQELCEWIEIDKNKAIFLKTTEKHINNIIWKESDLEIQGGITVTSEIDIDSSISSMIFICKIGEEDNIHRYRWKKYLNPSYEPKKPVMARLFNITISDGIYGISAGYTGIRLSDRNLCLDIRALFTEAVRMSNIEIFKNECSAQLG